MVYIYNRKGRKSYKDCEMDSKKSNCSNKAVIRKCDLSSFQLAITYLATHNLTYFVQLHKDNYSSM